MLQQTPVIIELAREPAPGTNLADVIISSLTLTGLVIVGAVVLGAIVAFLLVRWRRRHPPELDRLPPISPLVQGPHSRQ